jgi:hypothetical protein
MWICTIMTLNAGETHKNRLKQMKAANLFFCLPKWPIVSESHMMIKITSWTQLNSEQKTREFTLILKKSILFFTFILTLNKDFSNS